jgi:hypothetical protein
MKYEYKLSINPGEIWNVNWLTIKAGGSDNWSNDRNVGIDIGTIHISLHKEIIKKLIYQENVWNHNTYESQPVEWELS